MGGTILIANNLPVPKYKIDLNKGLSDTNITCE